MIITLKVMQLYINLSLYTVRSTLAVIGVIYDNAMQLEFDLCNWYNIVSKINNSWDIAPYIYFNLFIIV